MGLCMTLLILSNNPSRSVSSNVSCQWFGRCSPGFQTRVFPSPQSENAKETFANSFILFSRFIYISYKYFQGSKNNIDSKIWKKKPQIKTYWNSSMWKLHWNILTRIKFEKQPFWGFWRSIEWATEVSKIWLGFLAKQWMGVPFYPQFQVSGGGIPYAYQGMPAHLLGNKPH